LIIESPSIGYERYSISEAEEIIINKKFISSAHESSKWELDKRIARG